MMSLATSSPPSRGEQGEGNRPNGYDAIQGLAMISSGGVSRYIGVGYSSAYTDILRLKSLITSTIPGTSLALDTGSSPGFSADPYLSTAVLINPFPPFNTSNSPPAPYNTSTSPTGWQIGPADGAYGGGDTEKFFAVTPSLDRQYAIVVGYTSDQATGTLTGRTLPILLIYGIDGHFVNLGGYTSSNDLQNSL